jgi:CO/xanthine dehydrogenase FAD-binding subunit
MRPKRQTFSFFRPETLEEAIELLNLHYPRARLIAGGTDVMVQAKKGKLNADALISLNLLNGLRYIREEKDRLCIGGLTRLRDLEKSDLIARRLPALADAARNMASVQIRNVATVAGNLSNAAPSADTAPPLLVSGADVKMANRNGGRVVPLNKFFKGPGQTVMDPGEILTELSIPIPHRPYSQAFWKHSRRKAMDLALVSVAFHLELEDDLETCALARIALGVAAPTPIRTPEAEDRLKGVKITPETLSDTGDASCDESLCRDSIRGEAWYRQEIIKVMVRRMGLLALQRARTEAGR